MGSRVNSTEPDGETVNVDLRQRDVDGEAWRGSSGTGETSGGNETGVCDGFKISARECGNEEKDNAGGDLWCRSDLWTLGLLLGTCDIKAGVLIDVFDVLGGSEVRQADGFILEDDAAKGSTNNNKDISGFVRQADT